MHFEDSEGLRLVLINNNNEKVPEHWSVWTDSKEEEKHCILGLGPIEITVRYVDRLANTLKDLLGYIEVSRTDDEVIYQAQSEQLFGEIIVKQKEGPSEKPGRGSIHHLAIRVSDEAELIYWDQKINERGFQSSGIVNRYYFQSIYFRESNGILFEFATDGPGFTADSTIEKLGKQLDLPPFLEKRRAEIESKLKPLD